MFKVCIRNIFTVIAFFYASSTCAAIFVEGTDYTKMNETVRTSQDVAQLLAADPDKIQILMFFSYGCHGCEKLHEPFGTWVKKEIKSKNNVKVYYYPVSFNPQWAMLAKMYYIAQALDPSGRINESIFSAFHKQGLRLWQEVGMRNFFVKQGYKADKFNKIYKSFSIKQKVKRADELSKVFKIIVTPDLIVNGPGGVYKLELKKVQGNIPKFLELLGYVVEKEEKLLGKKK